jgi:hypothetical protein
MTVFDEGGMCVGSRYISAILQSLHCIGINRPLALARVFYSVIYIGDATASCMFCTTITERGNPEALGQSTCRSQQNVCELYACANCSRGTFLVCLLEHAFFVVYSLPL